MIQLAHVTSSVNDKFYMSSNSQLTSELDNKKSFVVIQECSYEAWTLVLLYTDPWLDDILTHSNQW